MIRIVIIFLFFFKYSYAAEIGETEITTEEGIEVFQNEKYYKLKKNVSIVTKDFELKANFVKAYFEENLYDITNVEAEENAILVSKRGIEANGEKIKFSIKNENILVSGRDSYLLINAINMFSNEIIKVDNLKGDFNLNGEGSYIKTENIEVYGENIDGSYLQNEQGFEVEKLIVTDTNKVNILTNSIEMFALKATYSKKINTIELFDEVKIIRGQEIIIGDYAIIDTLEESYKIKNINSKSVKVLISEENE